jgi:hypothetical protein
MVQIKALTTFLVATTLILPALAAPVDFQGSEDLVARDYGDDLIARDISSDVEPLTAREFTDDIDLEARDPRISRGARRFFGAIGRGIRKVAGAFFGRELDESEDLLSRDYTFDEDLD